MKSGLKKQDYKDHFQSRYLFSLTAASITKFGDFVFSGFFLLQIKEAFGLELPPLANN